jgi:hypothetical protein
MNGAAKTTTGNVETLAIHQAKNHCLKKRTPKSVSWWMATAVDTAVVIAA